ncbi:cytochrome b5 [Metarhizium guizhouense ARSEF 977]|uniref:Cytochrome b5 n=1 Tax=Metarhizium guizhouense (strain ARSEF 977) TaxID=1276136 RepID=A0A0B4GTB3_METGA|nr:cytochrome b5 [Metarhizium guizhouense ARSEF 977]
MSKEFTIEELSKYNTKEELFVAIRGYVYDVTGFLEDHPGGDEVLIDVAGQEATEAYDDAGHSEDADKTLDKFLVGRLNAPAGAGAGKTRNKGTMGSTHKSLQNLLLRTMFYLVAILVGAGAFSYLKIYIGGS